MYITCISFFDWLYLENNWEVGYMVDCYCEVLYLRKGKSESATSRSRLSFLVTHFSSSFVNGDNVHTLKTSWSWGIRRGIVLIHVYEIYSGLRPVYFFLFEQFYLHVKCTKLQEWLNWFKTVLIYSVFWAYYRMSVVLVLG